MKRKLMKSSLNHYVWFTPNDLSRTVYKNYINEILGKNYPEISRDLQVDEQGKCKMLLWKFMNVFGKVMFAGANPISGTQIIIEVDE